MKIYVKIGTEKRFIKFKKIVHNHDIKWYDGTPLVESFYEMRELQTEPFAMCIDTETPHLEYARIRYYKIRKKYIHIKLADLEQFLSEVL